MNLRVKLFAAFIGLIVVPLIGLGIVSFLNSEHLLEKKYSEQTEITLKAVGGNIRFFFKELDQITDASVTNSWIQEPLKANLGAEITKPQAQIKKNQADKELTRVLFQHPAISIVVLYAKDNMQYLASRNDPTTFRAIALDQLQGHAIYDQVVKRNGLPVWIGPYEEQGLTGDDVPLFTQMRLVKDTESFNDLGVMVTQYKTDEVDRMLQDFTLFGDDHTSQTRYLILNKNGLVMLDSEYHLEGKSIAEQTDLQVNTAAGYMSERARFSGQDVLFSAYNLDRSGWVLVSVKSWESLTNENMRFLQWIGGITLLCLLSAVLFNMLFVNRIAKAIIRVVRKMRLVEQGMMDTRVTAHGRDETVLLARSFNSMVETIGRLLREVRHEQERKQRAEMMLMQAQIKPHFLFNTLESINALAAQNDGRKVMLMVRRLSNLLRTSMHQAEVITVRQEIEHVRSYLEIQDYRFEDVFTYELDIADNALEFTILKLSLQPLVENSIQHGFEGLTELGIITISAEVIDGAVVFMVRDNGIGMSESSLRKLNGMEKENQGAPTLGEGERNGLGMRNVADRLRIHYGPAYGMIVCSWPGYGTVIRITIPRIRGEWIG
ncbi:cache domain-containing sensor histidine kinase [Paenibacillus methanolicus]|uniref:Histidine kinase/DNA gyrase B/HSP90-like ATPase n=1 Tax=Paenibacillus methanolicus TaxID=582686 RepID=A0A5S5BP73_9BACL|nr:sensor histidine kinase [Paenibacillus methanolicus]TYP68929.1 histidine kinase/DNA gyrase B/HSP90-like ATPase [Paenibacillus methanolicus]